MEYIKEKLPIITWTFVFVCLCCFSYFYLFESDRIYYTQVDNTKLEVLNSRDSMRFKYTLVMYDKNGHSKKIDFKTSRKLKEDAFLEVKYYNLSGVNSWREVGYDVMPNKVKKKYKK